MRHGRFPDLDRGSSRVTTQQSAWWGTQCILETYRVLSPAPSQVLWEGFPGAEMPRPRRAPPPALGACSRVPRRVTCVVVRDVRDVRHVRNPGNLGAFVSPQLRSDPAGSRGGENRILPSTGAATPGSPSRTVAQRYLNVSFIGFARLLLGSAGPPLLGKLGGGVEASSS